MYVFAVYASRAHLNNLWTNTCGLVSRRGTCFWDCRSIGHACATKCKKCEEGKAYVLRWKSFEDVSAVSHHTEREDNSNFSRRPHALFATLGAAALSHTHCSRCGLDGVVAAFTHSVFSSVFVPGFYLFLSHSHHHFVVATIRRPQAPLQRWERYHVHNFLLHS